MKESGWAYGLIALGLLVFSVIMLVQRFSTTNEQDFYLGREVLSSSMLDAVDYSSFRNGELVMIKEKFVEIFLRRFSESVPASRTYQIDFYDIREYPPKASVRIRTTSGDTGGFEANVDTLLSGVLETVLKKDELMDASSGLYWYEE
jgi:hypothetical protein